MATVTLEVLEGLERGRKYENLQTPVTIGREDDNSIRLNDDRISRFHAKIQDDGGRFILTDLDSTNGTRVNGHPVQIKILRPGDVLFVGRCILRFGSSAEIDQLLHVYRDSSGEIDFTLPEIFQDQVSEEDDEMPDLFPDGPPPVPESMTLHQRAAMSDMVAYIHERLRRVLVAGVEHGAEESALDMLVEAQAWQQLVEVELQLARYLKKIAEPEMD